MYTSSSELESHHAGEESGGALVSERLLEHAVNGQLAPALQHCLGKVQRHRDACRCRACMGSPCFAAIMSQ